MLARLAPVATQVLDATPEEPYLCVGIALAPAFVGSLMLEANLAASAAGAPVKARLSGCCWAQHLRA